MKLVVEIGDYVRDGKLEHYCLAHIEPNNNEEGIPTFNKSEQTERLARLIDLSKAVEVAVNNFYYKVSSRPGETESLISTQESTKGKQAIKVELID